MELVVVPQYQAHISGILGMYVAGYLGLGIALPRTRIKSSVILVRQIHLCSMYVPMFQCYHVCVMYCTYSLYALVRLVARHSKRCSCMYLRLYPVVRWSSIHNLLLFVFVQRRLRQVEAKNNPPQPPRTSRRNSKYLHYIPKYPKVA